MTLLSASASMKRQGRHPDAYDSRRPAPDKNQGCSGTFFATQQLGTGAGCQGAIVFLELMRENNYQDGAEFPWNQRPDNDMNPAGELLCCLLAQQRILRDDGMCFLTGCSVCA